MMRGRGVCVGARIMRFRRWRGRNLENASLICLEAKMMRLLYRRDVPEDTKSRGKIGTDGDWHRYHAPCTAQASQLPEYPRYRTV